MTQDRYQNHPALLLANADAELNRNQQRYALGGYHQYPRPQPLSAVKKLIKSRPPAKYIRKALAIACMHRNFVALEYILNTSRREGLDLDEDWVSPTEDDRHPIFDVLIEAHYSATVLRMLQIFVEDGRYCRRLNSARWRGASILDIAYGWRGDVGSIIVQLLSMGAISRVVRCVPDDRLLSVPADTVKRIRDVWDKFIDRRLEVFSILCGEAANGRQLLPADIWRKVHFFARP